MKILVIGSGGREHAVIKKLKESRHHPELFCCPGNAGIAQDATCVDIKATDIPGVVSYAKENKMDLVVVTPDDPLVLGMVDALNAEGIRAFGPNKAAAMIEGSKAFSKDMMKRHHIPTAKYETFDKSDKAMEYIRAQGKYPVVIKADGLALGKGVIIAQNEKEAEEAVTSMIEGGLFGASGSHVVIEEFLTGPEVSVLSFTDGKVVRPMVSSMDHKRAYDNDEGPNTGGMGTIAPNPHYTAELAEICRKTIFEPTIEAMKEEGREFHGCLYFGLMMTPDGPKVIEYNCRFGDPETQVVLPLLEGDLVDIMEATIDGTLSDISFSNKEENAACVVLASGGYPKKYQTGYEITGIASAEEKFGVTVYHAGTKCVDGKTVTGGGRVLGVTATAPTLEQALQIAYKGAEEIQFTDKHFRTDIGRK